MALEDRSDDIGLYARVLASRPDFWFLSQEPPSVVATSPLYGLIRALCVTSRPFVSFLQQNLSSQSYRCWQLLAGDSDELRSACERIAQCCSDTAIVIDDVPRTLDAAEEASGRLSRWYPADEFWGPLSCFSTVVFLSDLGCSSSLSTMDLTYGVSQFVEGLNQLPSSEPHFTVWTLRCLFRHSLAGRRLVEHESICFPSVASLGSPPPVRRRSSPR